MIAYNGADFDFRIIQEFIHSKNVKFIDFYNMLGLDLQILLRKNYKHGLKTFYIDVKQLLSSCLIKLPHIKFHDAEDDSKALYYLYKHIKTIKN